MAARLKVILLCLLLTISLQPKNAQGKTENAGASSKSFNTKELTGDFNRYLTENLAKQAIGLKEMEVRLTYLIDVFHKCTNSLCLLLAIMWHDKVVF